MARNLGEMKKIQRGGGAGLLIRETKKFQIMILLCFLSKEEWNNRNKYFKNILKNTNVKLLLPIF